MSFSTQKQFFNMTFINENVGPDNCVRTCVTLKSYISARDVRSWSMDETQKSKFLSELLSKNSHDMCSSEKNFSNIKLIHSDSNKDYMNLHHNDNKIYKNKKIDELEQKFPSDSLQNNFDGKENIEENEQNLPVDLKANHLNSKENISFESGYKNDTIQDNIKFIKIVSSSEKMSTECENELINANAKMNSLASAYEILKEENERLNKLVTKLPPCNTNSIDENSTNYDYGTNFMNGKTLSDIADKVTILEKKFKDADLLTKKLSILLSDQTKYINEMEQKLENLRSKYEQLLKCELNELYHSKCKSVILKHLQTEIKYLRKYLHIYESSVKIVLVSSETSTSFSDENLRDFGYNFK